MGLRRKFFWLLILIGATVGATFASTLWAVAILDRELAGPLEAVHLIARDLRRIKREAEEQSTLLPLLPLNQASEASPSLSQRFTPDDMARPAAPTSAAAYRASAARAKTLLEQLEADEQYRIRVGISTSSSLRGRVEAAADAGLAWFEAGDNEALRAAQQELFNTHELIERIEGRIIDEIGYEIGFGDIIRQRVIFIVLGSIVTVIAAGWLAMRFVERWVLQPVSALRAATAQLAGGDFGHRIEVEGSDEIAELSHEVNEMAGMITRMQNERVERERLAAMGEVSRRIVHNLRNPLAGIRSLAELTRSDMPPDSGAREMQERIITTVDRFESWLKELLTATRPLELQVESHPVQPWLRGTIEVLRSGAEAKGITLEVRDKAAPEAARFDARHLEQALVAVLTNAVQVSPEHSTVRITVEGRGDDRWRIRIADSGPGVPDELVERIFRPYFTTKRDGTGIGLALCKQVLEQHGGTIAVGSGAESGPAGENRGSGAEFIFDLPLHAGGDSANIGQGGNDVGENTGH